MICQPKLITTTHLKFVKVVQKVVRKKKENKNKKNNKKKKNAVLKTNWKFIQQRDEEQSEKILKEKLHSQLSKDAFPSNNQSYLSYFTSENFNKTTKG